VPSFKLIGRLNGLSVPIDLDSTPFKPILMLLRFASTYIPLTVRVEFFVMDGKTLIVATGNVVSTLYVTPFSTISILPAASVAEADNANVPSFSITNGCV